MTTTSTRIRRVAGISTAGLFLVAVPLVGTRPIHTEAATGLQLLAQAEHNTNNVRTLAHHDTQTVVGPTSTTALTLRGTEDELHNRETDSESVQYSSKTAKGKQRKVHYSLDIVFLNGKTYYRTSFTGNKWQTGKGMSLRDPYTGVGWRRGRTTVPVVAALAKHVTFSLVGTGGGLTHFHGTFKQSPITGTDDIWVSGGATPYVVREEERYHFVTNVHQTVVGVYNFDSFNSPVLISVPTKQAGA